MTTQRRKTVWVGPGPNDWITRDLTPEENAVRDRDEQRHAERVAKEAEEAAKPKPPTIEERLAAVEAKLAAQSTAEVR